MSPATFSNNLRRAGLFKPKLGPEAIRELVNLIQKPEPIITVGDKTDRSRKHSNGKHIGRLISTGMAVQDKDAMCYRATPAGVKWVQDLTEAKFI
jgi:hypothetical protein